MNLNGVARIWEQKGFVSQVLVTTSSTIFRKRTTQVEVFQDIGRVSIIKGGDTALIMSGINAVDVPLVVARVLSSVKPPVNDFEHLFEAIAYPKQFGQCTIYPTHVIENGVIYQDAGECSYLHSEAPHVSLMLFKGLYDRNREAELLLLNEFKSYQGEVFSGKIPYMSDDTVRGALLSLYDLGSIDSVNKRSIPSRQVQSALFQPKVVFKYMEEVSGGDCKFKSGNSELLWSELKSKYGLRDQLRKCDVIYMA